MENLILASSSARRKELLEQVGLKFDIFSPDIDESVFGNESVESYVERLAKAKAQAVLARFAHTIVIAADTSLSLDGQIIGKPESKQHAFDIWTSLSGREHEVFSGVCVASAKKIISCVVSTKVEFQTLTHNDMEKYWLTGEPIGKAGAYAIQGYAAQFIPNIIGSYSNVVGLPLHETLQLYAKVMNNG